MAEVTDVDRKAAAQWCYSQPFPSKQAEAPAIEAGEYDRHSLVQAFAAHREAAEKAERQAVVDWLLSDGARLDYEASGSEEHFSWWAADVVLQGDHRKG